MLQPADAEHSDSELLCARGWLASCPPAFADAVVRRGVKRRVARGEVVFRPGEPGGALYGVMIGAIAFGIPGREAVPHLAALAHPGDWFGDVGFFGDVPRVAQTIAHVDTRLLKLDLAVVEALTAEHPAWWRHFAELFVANHARVLREAYHFLRRAPLQRTALKLLAVTATAAGAVPLTQAELAEMTGLSRNTSNRVLNALQDAGIIRLGYGQIQVEDREALAAVAAGERPL